MDKRTLFEITFISGDVKKGILHKKIASYRGLTHIDYNYEKLGYYVYFINNDLTKEEINMIADIIKQLEDNYDQTNN